MTSMQPSHVFPSRLQRASIAVIACFALVNSLEAQDRKANDNSDRGQAGVGARIIDGSGGAPIENATLYIRNGRIEAVGRRLNLPAGVQRIDAKRKTIIPGLISAHSHVNDPSQFGIYL